MRKIIYLILIHLFTSNTIFSQNAPTLGLQKALQPITLDGILNEADWFTGIPAKDFWQNFPQDSVKAKEQTEVYMTYDDEMLYVAVKCYSSTNDYTVQTLKRDYSFRANENISILLDTYSDKTNAFLFGMNPYGVRREALISNGGRQFGDFLASWDNKWFGESKIHDGYWVAEFAIPFSTLRFNEGGQNWRFNCYRYNAQINEISTWIRIPRNILVMDTGKMGDMVWDEPLKKSGTNVSLIPFVTAGSLRDFEDDSQTKAQITRSVGGDAKIAITSGLNLDLTVNPDFSQVEVDQQVTNLNRFEIFFPERRQFFLENADLFSSFGFSRVNPFFSRRIGVSIDTATGQNIQNAIRYGARLSGKLNDNLRVGLLNMQTAKQSESGLPGFNYTVAALQHKVFSRSNIAAFLVNKQAYNPEGITGDFNPYNRVVGVDYNLATPNNTWTGKTYFHRALTTEDEPDKFAHGLRIEHLKRRYRLEYAHLYTGQGYDAETGFVPRRDIFLISPEFDLFFYPTSNINQVTISFDANRIYKQGKDGNEFFTTPGLSDERIQLGAELQFKAFNQARIRLTNNYVFLLNDFDPTRVQTDSLAFLPAGSAYRFTVGNASYGSDRRKTFSYEIATNIGQLYSGFRAGVEGSFTYRYQPYGFISIDYAYNYIRFDAPFEPVNLWLVGPRLDLSFTKKLFLSAFVQYNSQLDNLNINARFQWRFQPVSDFFLVYTDNYLTDPFSQFSVRNRAIVAKLTYWLNL